MLDQAGVAAPVTGLAESTDPSPWGCQARAGLRPAWGSSPAAPAEAGTSHTAVVRAEPATPTSNAPPSRRSQDRRFRLRPCWSGPASLPAACSLWPELQQAVPALCPPLQDAGRGLRHCQVRTRLHLAPFRAAPLTRTSDALHSTSSCWIPLLLVQPFIRLATNYYGLG